MKPVQPGTKASKQKCNFGCGCVNEVEWFSAESKSKYWLRSYACIEHAHRLSGRPDWRKKPKDPNSIYKTVNDNELPDNGHQSEGEHQAMRMFGI